MSGVCGFRFGFGYSEYGGFGCIWWHDMSMHVVMYRLGVDDGGYVFFVSYIPRKIPNL